MESYKLTGQKLVLADLFFSKEDWNLLLRTVQFLLSLLLFRKFSDFGMHFFQVLYLSSCFLLGFISILNDVDFFHKIKNKNSLVSFFLINILPIFWYPLIFFLNSKFLITTKIIIFFEQQLHINSFTLFFYSWFATYYIGSLIFFHKKMIGWHCFFYTAVIFHTNFFFSIYTINLIFFNNNEFDTLLWQYPRYILLTATISSYLSAWVFYNFKNLNVFTKTKWLTNFLWQILCWNFWISSITILKKTELLLLINANNEKSSILIMIATCWLITMLFCAWLQILVKKHWPTAYNKKYYIDIFSPVPGIFFWVLLEFCKDNISLMWLKKFEQYLPTVLVFLFCLLFIAYRLRHPVENESAAVVIWLASILKKVEAIIEIITKKKKFFIFYRNFCKNSKTMSTKMKKILDILQQITLIMILWFTWIGSYAYFYNLDPIGFQAKISMSTFALLFAGILYISSNRFMFIKIHTETGYFKLVWIVLYELLYIQIYSCILVSLKISTALQADFNFNVCLALAFLLVWFSIYIRNYPVLLEAVTRNPRLQIWLVIFSESFYAVLWVGLLHLLYCINTAFGCDVFVYLWFLFMFFFTVIRNTIHTKYARVVFFEMFHLFIWVVFLLILLFINYDHFSASSFLYYYFFVYCCCASIQLIPYILKKKIELMLQQAINFLKKILLFFLRGVGILKKKIPWFMLPQVWLLFKKKSPWLLSEALIILTFIFIRELVVIADYSVFGDDYFFVIIYILVFYARNLINYGNIGKANSFKILSGIVFTTALICALLAWFFYDPEIVTFQFIYKANIIPAYNITFIIGLDGISLCFLLLTTFIMMLCWAAASQQQINYKEFIICLLLIEFFLILSFTVLDLFFFYVFFESVLIPMFVVIGYWGSRGRKIRAAYYFFLYTLFGSLFMLFGILYIYLTLGTTDFSVLLNTEFSQQEQYLLWVCFFIPFAIKIPMFPFHIWLPEAHVEAPTIGSIILASLLLKLGGYGFLRFTLPLFPVGSQFFSPLVYSLAIVSVVYASLITIRQIDLKRIIAYSSVAHMNLIVLGLFSYTQEGITGAIYLMIGHGIVSSALFFCVGIIYDRYQTRLIQYYGGLARTMPTFSFFLFFFTLANMGFPGTSNFIGEILILVGIFEKNSIVMFFAATGIVLSAVYSIWLYNRIIFGSLKIKYLHMNPGEAAEKTKFADLTTEESDILFYLTVLMFTLGVHSGFITELTEIPASLIQMRV